MLMDWNIWLNHELVEAMVLDLIANTGIGEGAWTSKIEGLNWKEEESLGQ